MGGTLRAARVLVASLLVAALGVLGWHVHDSG
jgi:hypothetical protein